MALIFVSFSSSYAVQTFLMWAIGADIFILLASFVGILSLGVSKKPELLNLLRSEEHTYRMKVLETLGDQQHVFTVMPKTSAETNPALPKPKHEVPLPVEVREINDDHE